jgi:hypothetical protein
MGVEGSKWRNLRLIGGDGVHLLTSALVGIGWIFSMTLLTYRLVSWPVRGPSGSRGALETSGDDFRRNSYATHSTTGHAQ